MGALVTVAQAAKELGCPPEKVRVRMRRGVWDLGTVVKSGSTYRYDIFRAKLDKLIGEEEGR